MSVNVMWSKPEVKDIPQEVAELAELIKAAAREYKKAGGNPELNEVCRAVAERLFAAGYSKADAAIPPYIDRLTYELKDFRESLGRIIEGTRLLKLTDEKAGQIERIMEHAKNRQEGR